MNGDIELVTNGRIYRGWKAASVRDSLDYFASSCDLTLTDTRAGEVKDIKRGSSCQVRIGGEPLITGYVGRRRPRYDSKSRSITVSVRSKTADLVDCSLPPSDAGSGQKNRQTLLQLATAIADRFGIKVRSEVSNLVPIEDGVLSPGQTPFEFLEIHARAAGVRLVTAPDGSLVISKASNERVGTALVLGENIEDGDGDFSESDRFSHYYILGQRASSNELDAESDAHITGVAEDLNVRYRPTTINAEGALGGLAEAKRRAEWQRNVQYGRSRQATYTVSGWHHRDGLWRKNTNVLVQDEWMGFTGKAGKGEWLMIGTVEYAIDEGGKRTRLTVMPKEAYDLIALPQDDGGGVW